MSFSIVTRDFNFKNTKLLNFKMLEKRGSIRNVEGTVQNKTNKRISEVEYKIYFKDGSRYSTRVGILRFRDIEAYGKVTFSHIYITVNELEGDDFIIKESKVKFAN